MIETLAATLAGKGATWLAGKIIGPDSPAWLRKIANALGLGDDATADAVQAALEANPDAYLKLRALELEETKAYIADVQDARRSDVSKVQATGKRDWFLYGLAGLIIVGFFALIAILMFVGMDTNSSPVVMVLFGALAALTSQVGNYFFGSSKGSADKTQMLAGNGKG